MLSVAFDYGIQVLALAGESRIGSSFAGYATSPLMVLTSNVPPQEDAYRERALEALRAAVGQADFEAQVARAAALSTDDAVQEALAQLDRLIAGSSAA